MHYECKACRFSAVISDEGVDTMRKHLKTHAGNLKDVFVVVKRKG